MRNSYLKGAQDFSRKIIVPSTLVALVLFQIDCDILNWASMEAKSVYQNDLEKVLDQILQNDADRAIITHLGAQRRGQNLYHIG